jgi:hypothetical protein
MGRMILKGDSIDDIRNQHREYIRCSGKGASQLTNGEHNPEVKDSHGAVLGHLSYNSRFWPAMS